MSLVKYVPSFIISWSMKILNFIALDLGIGLKLLSVDRHPFGAVVLSNVGSFGLNVQDARTPIPSTNIQINYVN